MQTTKTKAGTRLKLAAANLKAAAALADHKQMWPMLREMRALYGVDRGGRPFIVEDIVRYWIEHPGAALNFGALRTEALHEASYLRMPPQPLSERWVGILAAWRQHARRPDVPHCIREIFDAAGV